MPTTNMYIYPTEMLAEQLSPEQRAAQAFKAYETATQEGTPAEAHEAYRRFMNLRNLTPAGQNDPFVVSLPKTSAPDPVSGFAGGVHRVSLTSGQMDPSFGQQHIDQIG